MVHRVSWVQGAVISMITVIARETDSGAPRALLIYWKGQGRQMASFPQVFKMGSGLLGGQNKPGTPAEYRQVGAVRHGWSHIHDKRTNFQAGEAG